jgi:ATP synthase protein I
MNENQSLAERVGQKADRKIKAKGSSGGPFLGLGVMGIVGYSVAIPTLLGAGVGSWLDAHHPGAHNWTLPLLVAGLCIGCFNAWKWVSQENGEIGQ